MAAGGRAVLVAVLAMFDNGSGVFLRLFVLTEIVMMGRPMMMMMRRGGMMSGRMIMVLTRRMLW